MTSVATELKQHVCRPPARQHVNTQWMCGICWSVLVFRRVYSRELGRTLVLWVRESEPPNKSRTPVPLPAVHDSGAGASRPPFGSPAGETAPTPAPLSPSTYEITVESATDYGWACHACPPERQPTAVTEGIPCGADGFPTWDDAAAALDDHIVEEHPEHAHLVGVHGA